MIRSTAPRLLAGAALALVAAAVGAAGSTASDRAVYIVALSDPPLAAHAAALARTPGIDARSEKQAVRAALRSTDAQDYLQRLDAARSRVLGLAAQRFGRGLAPRAVYRYAANGMALALSEDEAQRLAGLPGVAAVRRERVLRVQTDAGPQWIGADALWNGAVGGVAATKGEGVVVGIIDTGINATHPSFAATGGDGYHATNPRGHFYGLCASGQAQCNAKLIGIYDFSDEGSQGADTVGHGSHTAGIAVGNAQTNSLHGNTVSLPRNVSGVAPHANLITYKGCNSKPIGNSPDGGTCSESWLVAAIDQATADQVDVINYSIGGTAHDPYQLLDDPTTDAHAMFQARAAGIVVAVSAGNDGPGPGTVTEPGNVPWVLTAANASHNRLFLNSIGAFSGAANAPGTLVGQGYTAGYGPAKIVYAGDFGNASCGVGDTQGTTPNGASNPFPPNTFHGEIVICDRGIYARVEKGYNVKAAGAGGYVLANAPGDGESVVSDDHFVPAVHLGYAEGQALKTWVAAAGTHTGTISGVSAALDPAFGDILDASSSRGPYGYSGGGVLKPDLTAPGDNILSAAGSGNGLALLSGTSMASPHVAGSAALVLAVHPNWTPAQVESTLVGTALADVRKEDGVTPALPIDAGAGRVQPALAVQAGLYLPLANADFFAGSGGPGNATAHGDLNKINRPGIESESCFQSCSFTRTVADISNGGTWQVSTTATTGAAITVTPNQFSLAAGASQPLAITVDVSDPHLPGNWVSGRIVLHKTGGMSAADIALTVAVYASPGQTQPFRTIAAPAPVGDASFQVSGLVALPQATFTTASLAPATVQDFSLGVDPTPGDLYGTFPGTGKQFVLVPNVLQQGVDTAAYGRAFIVEIAASNAPQTHLYAGIDSNGDGLPTANEQACHGVATFGSTAVARCVVDLRGAGAVNVWALVDIPSGGAIANSVRVSYGIPTVNVLEPTGLAAQQLHVVGPGHVDAGAGFPLRVFWGPKAQDDATAPLGAGTYYGAVMVDGVRNLAPADLGQAALIPLVLVSAGGVDAADALHPGVTRSVRLSGTQPSLQHTFIDVPPGATTLTFDTAFAAGATSAVTFSAIRTDFPPASPSAAIPAASDAAPATGWTIDAVTQSRHVSIPATPGRWYLTAQYANAVATTVTISANLVYGTGAPVLTPGNYFDPQRSGHGIFLSRAGGQQVVDWYTYLEDGTPTWYVAQNLAPAANAGVWTSTLYRASWDGSTATPTPVGDVTLTALSPDHAMFSWHLYGASGSEAFELLAAPACVEAGGNVDLNGEWYPPAQGGIGFDALVIPSQQFDAFYLYDAIGNPVWVVGGAGPFAATSTVPMLQSTGFCPLCDYRALTTQSAGTLDVTYAHGASGQIGAAITLNPPLHGSWNINQPIARLTGSSACTP